MSTNLLTAPWLFVIDTEDYAGNFERELCAYITGRVGECGVGDDMAELFKKEVGEPFDEVIEETDEHGCNRPTTIYPTPGWFNDGMGGHYKKGDEKRALVEYRKNMAEYHRNSCYHAYLKSWLEKPESRDGYIKAGWTEEKLKKAVADEETQAVKAENAKKIYKWPAYQSVAISFEKKPTDKQIKLMKERAEKFAKLPSKYVIGPKECRIKKIMGFRLIKNKVKATQKVTFV